MQSLEHYGIKAPHRFSCRKNRRRRQTRILLARIDAPPSREQTHSTLRRFDGDIRYHTATTALIEDAGRLDWDQHGYALGMVETKDSFMREADAMGGRQGTLVVWEKIAPGM